MMLTGVRLLVRADEKLTTGFAYVLASITTPPNLERSHRWLINRPETNPATLTRRLWLRNSYRDAILRVMLPEL